MKSLRLKFHLLIKNILNEMLVLCRKDKMVITIPQPCIGCNIYKPINVLQQKCPDNCILYKQYSFECSYIIKG